MTAIWRGHTPYASFLLCRLLCLGPMSFRPYFATPSRPLCSEIEIHQPERYGPVYFQLASVALGVVSNIALLTTFSGRAKLSTASFTYIRILACVQFVFFMIPFPLKLLTEQYQRGQTWIAANLLPLLLGFFHFAVATVDLCFAVRLQLLVNYVTRCRRWNSLPWVAWRKTCWIVPFGIIANVSLAFEYQLDYDICILGNRTTAIGRARLSEVIQKDATKLEVIRAIPTMMFWLTAVFGFGFLLSERCVLPKIGSPNVVKHRPLFANLRPLLSSIVVAHSPVNVYYTFCLLQGKPIDNIMKLMLYSIGYTLPFPLMFIFSHTFRSHIFHMITKNFQKTNRNVARKDSTLRRVTKRITRSVAFSKLEMENSEFEETDFERKRASMRSVLRDDAVYRVRFAHSVAVIEETEEGVQEYYEIPDIESAQYLQSVVVEPTFLMRPPMYD